MHQGEGLQAPAAHERKDGADAPAHCDGERLDLFGLVAAGSEFGGISRMSLVGLVGRRGQGPSLVGLQI